MEVDARTTLSMRVPNVGERGAMTLSCWDWGTEATQKGLRDPAFDTVTGWRVNVLRRSVHRVWAEAWEALNKHNCSHASRSRSPGPLGRLAAYAMQL